MAKSMAGPGWPAPPSLAAKVRAVFGTVWHAYVTALAWFCNGFEFALEWSPYAYGMVYCTAALVTNAVRCWYAILREPPVKQIFHRGPSPPLPPSATHAAVRS